MLQSIKDFTKHELADICPCGPLPPRTTRKRIHKQHWLSMADPYIAVTICNWQEGRDITQFTHFFCFFCDADITTQLLYIKGSGHDGLILSRLCEDTVQLRAPSPASLHMRGMHVGHTGPLRNMTISQHRGENYVVDSLDIPPKSWILIPEWLWFSMDSSCYQRMGVAYQLCSTAEATDNMGPHIKSIQSRNKVRQARQVQPSIPSLARLNLSKEEQALLYMLDVIPTRKVDAILQTDTHGKDGYMKHDIALQILQGQATMSKAVAGHKPVKQRKVHTTKTINIDDDCCRPFLKALKFLARASFVAASREKQFLGIRTFSNIDGLFLPFGKQQLKSQWQLANQQRRQIDLQRQWHEAVVSSSHFEVACHPDQSIKHTVSNPAGFAVFFEAELFATKDRTNIEWQISVDGTSGELYVLDGVPDTGLHLEFEFEPAKLTIQTWSYAEHVIRDLHFIVCMCLIKQNPICLTVEALSVGTAIMMTLFDDNRTMSPAACELFKVTHKNLASAHWARVGKHDQGWQPLKVLHHPQDTRVIRRGPCLY